MRYWTVNPPKVTVEGIEEPGVMVYFTMKQWDDFQEKLKKNNLTFTYGGK